jgi:VWFA-related protein
MRFPRIAAVIVALTVLSAASSATSDDSITSSGVVISIVPTKDGQAPPAPTDLAVRDDKRPAPVSQLRPLKDEPLVFSLLVDGSGSMRPVQSAQNAAAVRLFKALSKPVNQGHLILFQDDEDNYVTNEVLGVSRVEEILKQSVRRGATVFYDAIAQAVTDQLTPENGPTALRRAIFVFSDGDDNFSHTGFQRVLGMLQRGGISLFAIHVPEPDTRRDPNLKRNAKEGLDNFRELAQVTGGKMVEMDETGAFVSEIVNAVDNQYLLSLTLPPGVTNQVHTLEVKCPAGKFTVFAPAVYFPQ